MREDEKQRFKKRSNISSNSISKFFVAKEPFKKDDVQQKQNLEDLGFLIVTNHLPLQFVENSWLKKINMHLCPRILFFFGKQFSYDFLPKLIEKIKQS